MAESSDSDSIPGLESADSWFSEMDEPEITLNERDAEILMTDLPLSPVEFESTNCSSLPSVGQGCCDADTTNDRVHNISCDHVDFTDYPFG